MARVAFYFDESVEVVVSLQVSMNGIDAVSAHSLGTLGDSDLQHLERATVMGRVLCTYDADFLRLHKRGLDHAGILFAPEQRTTIGDWVREVRALHDEKTSDSLRGRLVFLRLSR